MMSNSNTKKNNQRGSGVLILVIVMAILSSLIALSTAQISNAMFSSLNSSSVALQAQQYADNKATIIKATSYDNLDDQHKNLIKNTNFKDEIVLSNETESEDYLTRTATVNVYYKNETSPRVSLAVLRTNAATSDMPVGTVISWFGNISYIPDGWLLCDGSKGTPDLRNRFITGAGDIYAIGDIGGEASVKLSANEMPNHFHSFGYHNNNNGGYFLTAASTMRLPNRAPGTYPGKWNGSGGGSYWSWDSGSSFGSGQNLITSYQITSSAADNAHENRPPFFALFYLIKN